MQNVSVNKPATAFRSATDLMGLATPVLEVVMQLKGGLITASNDLRGIIAGQLKLLEQTARSSGYPDDQVQSTKFALAAFVDETVLTANFPLRDQWEKVPLQLEYFGEHLAGVTFFERLDGFLKSIDRDAEIVEVYYLCLLMGFKGKYKIYRENELRDVVDNVAGYLRRANRLKVASISPHWKVTDQPQPVVDTGIPAWIKFGLLAGIGVVALVYVVLLLLLRSELGSAIEQLLR